MGNYVSDSLEHSNKHREITLTPLVMVAIESKYMVHIGDFMTVKIFFSRIGTREEVVSLLHLFVSSIQKEIDPQEVCFQIIQKLKNIRDIANQSIFFKNYKVKFLPILRVVRSPYNCKLGGHKINIFFSLLEHRCCSSWKPTVSM